MQQRRARRESHLNESLEPNERQKPTRRAAYDSRRGSRVIASGSHVSKSDVSDSEDGLDRGDHAFEAGLPSSEAMLPPIQPFQVPALEHHPQTTLPRIIDAYQRRYAHIATIRFENAVRRMEAHYQWDAFQQHLSNLQESAGVLVARSAVSKSDYATKKPRTQFKKHHARMQSDLKLLSTKIQAVDELMADLRARDRRAEMAEQALDNASRALITAVQRSDSLQEQPYNNGDNLSETSLAPTSVFGSESPVAASPEMSPLAVEFYEAVSTYKIMRERLFDLDVERQEQGDRRLLLADQDQVLDQTDEEFNAMWEETFIAPENDFDAARKALQRAQRTCIEAGVDIPALEDLQIPNTEGDQELPKLTTADLPPTILSSQQFPTVGPPSPTSVKPTSHRKLFGESLAAQELSPSPTIEPQDLLHDSSPATPAGINTERISQWMESMDLGVVNQSLAKFSLSSSSGPSSAFATSTNNHTGKTQANGSRDLSGLPSFVTSGRQRAKSLPQKLEFESGQQSDLPNGKARLPFKPP